MRLEIGAATDQRTNSTSLKSRHFEIGDASMIIEILRSKLYSNPIQTLVQEYVSNARDANREAKATRPIRITVPTHTDMTLIIRDFGPGLTPERVDAVFCKYGKSTKRNDSNQVGGFGIGAKSAWAYTDSFTVVTYVDGTAYHYVAHVASDHAGSLDLISEHPTQEPNGTEIHVAAKLTDISAFAAAIARCTQYWKDHEKPEIINRSWEEPKYLMRLNDGNGRNIDVLDKSAWSYGEIKIVIDGIPYPMPKEWEWEGDAKVLRELVSADIMLHFGTEIMVAANREAIATSEGNRILIQKLVADAVRLIGAEVAARIDAANTLKDAITVIKACRKKIKTDRLFSTRLGVSVTLSGQVKGPLTNGLWIVKYEEGETRYGKKSGKVKRTTTQVCNFDFTENENPEVYFVDDDFSQSQTTRRVKDLVLAKKKEVFVIDGDKTRFEQFRELFGVVALSSIQTKKLTRMRRKEGQVRGVVFDNSKEQRRKTVLIDLNVEKLHLYLIDDSPEVTKKEKTKEQQRISSKVAQFGIQMIVVPPAMAELIKEADNENLVDLELFKKNPKDYLSKEQFDNVVLSVCSKESSDFENENLIEDPEYKAAIVKNKTRPTVYYGSCFSEWSDLNEVKKLQKERESINECRKNYPLFGSINSWNQKGLAENYAQYVNLLYRSRS
jgi:hypothetical protein